MIRSGNQYPTWWGRLPLTAAIAATLVLSACGGDDLSPEGPGESTDSASSESLTTTEQAVGPATGDFSTCEEVLLVDTFDDPGSDLEVVDGRLQLRSSIESRPDLWIANAGRGTVARINGRTGSLVSTHRAGSSPSRTALDLNFDVYVANRAFNTQGTVQKYDASCTCPGADPYRVCSECTLWTRNVGTYNEVLRAIGVAPTGEVWVGSYNGRRIFRLDPATGNYSDVNIGLSENLDGDDVFSLDWPIYGLVVDRDGLIWTAGLNSGIQCFDPTLGQMCGRFTIPGCNRSYGIALDRDQNIWFGGWTCNNIGVLNRASYEAEVLAHPADWWNRTPSIRSYPVSGMSYTRGIAVDGDGQVWVASSGTDRIFQFDPGIGGYRRSIATCDLPIGVGITEEGDVWSMCYYSNRARAHRLDSGALRYDVYLGSGAGPYSYSDFTGFQLRNFTAPEGSWSGIFECGADGCGFDWIEWDAVVPAGAGFEVSYRGSMDGTTWTELRGPYDSEPQYVLPDGTTPRYVEIVLFLEASPSDESPSVDYIRLWQCPDHSPPTGPAVDQRWIVSDGPPNYGISWRFTDASWPETFFQGADMNEPPIPRCTVTSTTSRERGDVYSGTGATPACREEGWPSNEPLTRRFRSMYRNPDGSFTNSDWSESVTAYTAINEPDDADIDIVSKGSDQMTLRWCRPDRNTEAGQTGAYIEMSSTPGFTSGVQIVADWDAADRGYADANACGNVVVTGLNPGTTYYVRMRYRNGDGVPSSWHTISDTTWGASCCYNDICVGVCVDGGLGPDGCEPPDAYEDPEVTCDGLDNDCDGRVDEGLLNACGECGPTPAEVCNLIDDDCDGAIDDDPIDGLVLFPDVDGDGYGDEDADPIRSCTPVPGYVPTSSDCNDSDGSINPAASEICNFIDDDCDDIIDEGAPPITYYRDRDGDTWGDPATTTLSCAPPAGYVLRADDCNDSRADANPDADEVCDLIDNDCDTLIDEGFMDVTVQVTDVATLDEVGVGVCDNDFGGRVCQGTLAATVRIANDGTVVVPDDVLLSFYFGAAGGTLVGGPMETGQAVPVGSFIERTFCFGPAYSETTVDLTARLTGDAGFACQAFDGSAPGVDVGDGDEICDGIDNDCDGRTDESPEACGPILDCIEADDGDYECVATLGAETASTEPPADEAGDESDDEGAFNANATDDVDEPRAGGCAAGGGSGSAPAGALALGLLGLAVVRRRR